MNERKRADRLLVERGLFESRAKAQAQFAVKEEKMVEEVKKLLAKHSIKH